MAASVVKGSKELLHDAIAKVLNDTSFNSKAPKAAEAIQAATRLHEWCQQQGNEPNLVAFAEDLVTSLQKLLESVSRSHLMINRDKMWGKYYSLRSSEPFLTKWTTFLDLSGTHPTPILYQHLTDIVFRAVIRDTFVIFQNPNSDSTTLTFIEENALRYAAGYVCQHLCKTLARRSHPLKADLILCLSSLIKCDNSNGRAEDWTNSIDRGGLTHVEEMTFALFRSIEDECQEYLKQLPSKPDHVQKLEIIQKLLSNDDVQFYWCILSADFETDDKETHDELLKMIAELYLTMRGFAFANTWIEKYKQREKKSTQKSKSLRTNIYSTNAV